MDYYILYVIRSPHIFSVFRCIYADTLCFIFPHLETIQKLVGEYFFNHLCFQQKFNIVSCLCIWYRNSHKGLVFGYCFGFFIKDVHFLIDIGINMGNYSNTFWFLSLYIICSIGFECLLRVFKSIPSFGQDTFGGEHEKALWRPYPIQREDTCTRYSLEIKSRGCWIFGL